MLDAVIRAALRYRVARGAGRARRAAVRVVPRDHAADRRVARPRPAARRAARRVPRPGAGGGRGARRAPDRDRASSAPTASRRSAGSVPPGSRSSTSSSAGRWTCEAARQTVQERLATVAGQLPPGVRPEMTPTSSIMGQIMHVGVSSKDGTTKPMELGTLADWVVRPRLLKIPGVAEVIVMGGERKQYQVLVDPDALREYGVTLQEVEAALRANNLNTTGGFAVRGRRRAADPRHRPARARPGEGDRGPESGSGQAAQTCDETRHGATARPVLLEQVARVVGGAGAQARRRQRQRRAGRRHHGRQAAARRHPRADRRRSRRRCARSRRRCRPTWSSTPSCSSSRASSTAASTTSARRWSSGPCWC